MKTLQITVTGTDSRGRAISAPAAVAICPDCECEQWIVFQIKGQNHPHLQCATCGVSFCPNGSCNDNYTI